MQCVIMLSLTMLCVFILSVILLSLIMLNVSMLSVVEPFIEQAPKPNELIKELLIWNQT